MVLSVDRGCRAEGSGRTVYLGEHRRHGRHLFCASFGSVHQFLFRGAGSPGAVSDLFSDHDGKNADYLPVLQGNQTGKGAQGRDKKRFRSPYACGIQAADPQGAEGQRDHEGGCRIGDPVHNEHDQHKFFQPLRHAASGNL